MGRAENRRLVKESRQQARRADVARCPYCRMPDDKWAKHELNEGKRFRPNLTEYHCEMAFYGAQ
jgi:hypothetical protein